MNATVSEIRNTIALFGSTYRERFNDLVRQSANEQDIEKLGIAVRKRNQDAHDNPPDITFRELEEAYTVAICVVDAVGRTLKA